MKSMVMNSVWTLLPRSLQPNRTDDIFTKKSNSTYKVLYSKIEVPIERGTQRRKLFIVTEKTKKVVEFELNFEK